MIGKLDRVLSALFTRKTSPPARSRRPRFRPQVEALEVRYALTTYVWTAASGGFASTAANWTPSAVPGSGDYVLFGDGGLGADTACAIDIASWNVDRIIMDSNYTSTITIGAGNVVTTTNFIVQYGGLDLSAYSAVVAGDYIDINGAVTASITGAGLTPPSASLAASGSLFLETGASITATGSVSGGNVLDISSAGFDDAGAVNAGDGVFSGTMSISGPITALSSATINVTAGSLLSFLSGGGTSHPTIEGTMTLGAGLFSSGGAAVSSQNSLIIHGGTLDSLGSSSNAIAGDITVDNGGVMNIGTSSAANALEMSTGSLAIDATLNVYGGSHLSFPAAGGATSTFTAGGAVNMYGGFIEMLPSRVSTLNVTGYLNSFGTTGGGADTISGSLTNNGHVVFDGTSLHALAINAVFGAGGDYTQGSSGELAMRLVSTPASDVLAVADTAIIDGTLTLTGSSLTSNIWTPITTGSGGSGIFSTLNKPDAGTWNVAYDAPSTSYKVTKS